VQGRRGIADYQARAGNFGEIEKVQAYIFATLKHKTDAWITLKLLLK